MNILFTLTSAQLKRAAAIKEEIASLEKSLAAILGSPTPGAKTSATKPLKKKRKMSVAARTKIAAAQKARWAKIKAAKKA
jgi:hypothetical protein